jgi:hypothetical protein
MKFSGPILNLRGTSQILLPPGLRSALSLRYLPAVRIYFP